MIGLGSNRLTVCRRGGMSVTQFGMAGMSRTNDFFGSPYSAQATAALKAQFPTQWPTIRDYGFAHPEIVPYVNAYVTEDIKIIYSLVPTLNVIRLIKTDGNAYINTGETTSIDDTVECQCVYGSTTAMPFGARGNGFGDEPVCCATYYNSKYQFGFCGASGGAATGPNISTTATMTFKAKGTETTCLMNGVSYTKVAGTSGTTITRPIYLLCVNRAGNKFDSSPNSIVYYRNYSKSWWVPFIRNNVKGMLEMVSNTFKANAGSGTMTISETPAS